MGMLDLLIVEDEPSDVELMVRELKKSGFDPVYERVETREQFVRCLSEGRPDAILYDHNIPQFNSLEALQLVQQSGRDIPFVIVSHAMRDEEAVGLMRAGAADYVLKDRLGRLGEAVRLAIEQRCLRQERAAARESLIGLNAELESRIASRTAELQVANHALEQELEQRTRAEAALRRLNGELEERVIERTRSLAESNRRLQGLASELTLAEQRERKRLAVELHDYLAQMLALGRMKTMQLRNRVVDPQAAKQLVGEIDEVFQKAGEYTRTLMAKLNPPVLDDLGLPAALVWLGKQMPLHGLTVDVSVAQDHVPLPEEQSVLLFQSVRELLINVAKHARTKQASVTLRVDEDHRLLVSVKDRGSGFDPVALEAKGAGAHFGLLSIRERMRAMGGRLDVRSETGRGTTATLSLRLRTAGDESQVTGDQRTPHAFNLALPMIEDNHSSLVTRHTSPSPIRVLLVDDHAMVRQGLRNLLESYPDIEIVGEAANGEEAIAAIAKWEPEIVVMDIHMPKLSGIEATAHIKRRYPETVIIGLSVRSCEGTEEAMVKAGASMLVAKDAVVEQLYAGIQSAFSRAKEKT
ncbi:MAG TPA: response regulator [Nitrospira sp.]|nr:response regulator [Nitrospira sp.]